MGVDNDCIFAYGFLLRPFDNKLFTYDELEKFLVENNLNSIEFVTDGYYPDSVFVYICKRGDNKVGFHSSNRGYYPEFQTISNLEYTFQVTEDDVKSLQQVRDHFKNFLIGESIGWRPFCYSH